MVGLSLKRGRARIPMFLAGLLTLGAASGFAVARFGWAAEPETQKSHAAAKPPVSDAQVAARTAPLADLEQAFMAIADRMQPSVCTILVDKTVKAASTMQGMPDVEDL